MSDLSLAVKDVNVYYGSAHVLHGVSFEIGREPVALIGRNGMGKTTLCNAMMGLVPIKSGSIRLDGAELGNIPPHQIVKNGIGYVPQGRRIFPSLTVHEHLKMVDQGSGQAWNVKRIYELFPRLAERKRSGAGKLSGGEQQMLAIGRALLLNAKVLIMDEPSEGLAPVIVEQLCETLNLLSREKIGLLVIEQKLAVAAAVAERMLVMVNGRIALETTSAEMMEDEAAQRRYLGVGRESA